MLALVAADDGSVYAGTGPGGKIVRLGPKGDAQGIADKLDSYIWGLAYDPLTKALYAGTGPKGASTRSMHKAVLASSTPRSRSTSSVWR